MFPGAVQRRTKAIYIHILHFEITGVHVEHIKMDVIQGVHKAGHIDNVLKYCPPAILRPRILYVQGRAPSAHIDLVASNLTIQLTVFLPTTELNNGRRFMDQFFHKIPIHFDYTVGIIHLRPCVAEEFPCFSKVHLHSHFGKHPQAGFVDFFYVLVAQRPVPASLQPFSYFNHVFTLTRL